MKPDYKGFCLEYTERVRKGFPIDSTIMKEMAEKYGTPWYQWKGTEEKGKYVPWKKPEEYKNVKCFAMG